MTAEQVHTSADSTPRLQPKARHFLGWAVVISLGLVGAFALTYFATVKWAVRHEMLSLYDTSRQRPVAVDIAVRRDVEIQAAAGMLTMPVVVINHGKTVRFTEYS